MSVTISSDVPATLTLTLHPVCFSNGVTQFTLGSSDPFSTYPAQATKLTWPSPVPSADSLSIFGGVNLVVVPPVAPAPLLHPATTSRPTAAIAALLSMDRMGAPLCNGAKPGLA